MSEEIEIHSCCSSSSPAATDSPIDNDDLLREILLRLPSLPSSLPRASAVCKRWRRLVANPRFLRSFRDHHRKEGPPILGFFEDDSVDLVFHHILDPPDSVPLRIDINFRCFSVLGCRHGRLLIIDTESEIWQLFVCTPVTGEQQRVPIPTDFKIGSFIGSVMCAASDLGHVHGACHSSHFKAVLVATYGEDDQTIARVYSSETGTWGNLISTPSPYLDFSFGSPGCLVGKSLYWLSMDHTILELNLEEKNLAMVSVPPCANNVTNHQIILAVDAAVGFAALSYPCLQMWQRNVNCHGAAAWVPWKTIQVHTILGLPPQTESARRQMEYILCYDEDTDTIFLSMDANIYMVQIKSLQFKRLYRTNYVFRIYPFKSFYPPGTRITGGGAEMVHDR